MKVLHVDSGRTWRGGQAQALGLAKGLQARGAECVMACNPASPLQRASKDAGVPVVSIPIRSDLDLIGVFKLGLLLRSLRPDVVHFHCAHSHSVGVLAAVLFRSSALRVMTRRVDFDVRTNLLSRIKYDRGLDSIIAISEGVKSVLEKCGVAINPIPIIRSGIDLEKFGVPGRGDSVREELGIPKDCLVVGSVAALAPHKAQNYLVDAAAMVLKKREDVIFVLAGEGELRSALEKQIGELGLGDRFLMLGFRQDVRDILDALDVFVLSSYLEGLCTSLLDAMAAGLPVVATSVGGIPEVVVDGRTGILVPVGDSRALADEIDRLLSDAQLRKGFGEQGRIRSQEFSIDNTVDQTYQLYEELLTKRAS